MPPVLSSFVVILALFTITEANKSLQEIEQILKKLAAQTVPKNRPKNFLYLPHYPRLEFQQTKRNKHKNNHNYDDVHSPGFVFQLNNMRIQKQLEDDLQQALRFESDRICKATGRCGCFGGRCGKPHRAVDRTVNDMEQLLHELNRDLNKQQNKNYRDVKDRRQRYDDRRQKYGEYADKRKEYRYKGQEYYNRKQKQHDSRLEYDDSRQEQYDIRQEQDGKRQDYNKNRHYSDYLQQYNNQKQLYNYKTRDDRRQKFRNSRQYRNSQQQYNDKYNEIIQEQDDRRQQYIRTQIPGDKQQQFDDEQQYDDRREEQDTRQQKNDDRKQQYEDEKQEYKIIRQTNGNDDNSNVGDNLDNNLKLTSGNHKNAAFDIVVVEVPESNELQTRADDVKVIDVRESGIRDILQKQLYDKNEKKDSLNLEDFVKYYEKIKESITNGLLKYVKGQGDDSYLSRLLSYQKKQIENLKNIQSKTPLADNVLKTKIVQLLFGRSSNIKLLPHSRDDQTIYIPEIVHNTIPLYNKNNALRSIKRLFPLTFYQKQRQRNMSPRNLILKHAWRRNNQQTPGYGVPFNLQVQGLGQIN